MTEQQLVSPRGVIVAWLEQGDHFVQATAFSTLAGVYPRRSVAELHAAEQIECQALCELAAAVNAVVPQSHWNGEYARQMLQRYLMEFRAAARQASLPGFTLSTTDEAFGIRTIEDKLNLMCPHFVKNGMDMAAHSANDSTDQRTEGVVEIKQNNSPKELTTPSKVMKRAVSAKRKQKEQQKKQHEKEKGIRQPDFSDSDYAPSDREDEEEEEKASTPSSQSTNNVHGPRSRQETPAATVMTAPLNGKFSNQGPPTVSRGSSTASPKATLMAGHIPPLLSVPRTISGDTNLERKRAFFCAKLLAFEQFKWVGENQLQQQEVELLRREMETRKAFVQMEIQLQRTDIRAATIQRMILVGANVEDIAERLTLLTRTV
ncbi:hypothetical protein JG687_00009729 [Phytophthora cactorum]|uniref:Uncharacterized protein n=1 Tax=Phytophthora cactorum TaxID=29920 RepID=A0A8T1U904_9STRA|nr:hypothetical protein JG687_00009729 [Phytophthora cactorum]